MGRNSRVSWCDHSFNPWWGCVQIGIGCVNCYARDFAERLGYDVWGKDKPRRLFEQNRWNEPRRWNRVAEKAAEKHKIFCGSMCDVFEIHPDPIYNANVLDVERQKLWDLIEETPNLIWMLLTKRPENIQKLLPERWALGWGAGVPRHIWFGVSASTQAELNDRWAILDSETHYLRPSILFLSLEPLVEPVDLAAELEEIDCGDEEHDWWTRSPDWVILGAESGRKRRPFDASWAVRPYRQCSEAGIPFFGKQDSGLGPEVPLLINGKVIKRVPKI